MQRKPIAGRMKPAYKIAGKPVAPGAPAHYAGVPDIACADDLIANEAIRGLRAAKDRCLEPFLSNRGIASNGHA